MRLLFLIFCCVPLLAVAQTDSLIYAEGKITNAITKEPIVAKVSYQSLPYGSKVGFLHTSSFSFPLYDNEKYSITIEVQGYAPSKFILDPAEANSERKVIRDVALNLPGHAGDSVVHHVGKVLLLNIIFEQGKYAILPASYGELNALSETLRTNPKLIIQLEGHTDVQGDPKKNLQLSKDRVEAVKKYLVEKKISANRIKTKAFGGTQPISNLNTPEAHRLNRRVAMRVLQD
jgi:OmpA-OmpF porin, OOP family